MPDEIFVGSVSVGVVPDLRGFNTKMRKELLPAANELGKAMGRELTKGLRSEFDMTKIVAGVTPSARVASLAMGREMGKETTKGFKETFDIGRVVVEASRKARPVARVEGRVLGDIYGKAFRSGLDDALKDVKAKVDVDLNKASLARARAQINATGASIKTGVSHGITSGVKDATDGPGGSTLRSEVGKFFGTGILSGLASLPPQIQIGLAAGAAAAAPFIGQVLGGAIISFLGTGLLGLGIAGAVGLGKQVPSKQIGIDQTKLDAANKRVEAAQQRLNDLQGKGGVSASGLASARARLASAQDNLNKLEGSGTATSLGLQAARDRVAAAEANLGKVRGGGKATASQLQTAEAQLESARAAQAAAQQKRQEDGRHALTKSQESVRKSFQDLQQQFYGSLSKIGQSFAPVLINIASVAGDVLGKLTPVFSKAVGALAGPFEQTMTILITSLTDPQVTSAIQAVAIAFGDIMKAFAPDIPGIVNSFADAIERIAQAVEKNPKAFADFLNFMFQVGIFALNLIAWLTDAADWIEKHWDVIGWFVSPLIQVIQHWSTISGFFKRVFHDIAHAFDVFRHGWSEQWDLFWQDTIGRTIRANRHLEQLISGWLHNIAHWFDVGRHWVASIWDAMWQATIGSAIRQQRHLQQLISAWLHNLAHWFDIARHDVAAAWDSMWSHLYDWAIKGWGKIYNNVWVPVRDFFTKTLPSWFDNAVKAVGGVWDKIRSKLAIPIKWVAQHVLSPLFNAIDAITNFVGLHKPLQSTVDALATIRTAAGGAYINSGAGPRVDDNLALLARGELVVPSHMVDAGYVDHLRGAIPGFQGGGGLGLKSPSANSPYTNPVGPGAVGSRIDMGVDYTGTFDLFALGSGIIRNLYNSQWPGGTYITLQLDTGQYKDALWFYAEHIIPLVKIGQRVKAGQKIGHAPGGNPWTELGWSYNTTGTTMAAHTGQSARGSSAGDAGKYSTAWGVAANNLIVSLGGPSGVVSPGGISGGGPNALQRFIGGIIRTAKDILSGLKGLAGAGLDLFHGNIAGALAKLLGKAKSGVGGAGGVLASVLGKLPAQLATSVLKHIVSGVKSFVQGQQQASGGMLTGGKAGQAAQAAMNFAKSVLGQYGWGPGQFPPLQSLWMGESGWRWDALNPGSGAYGIPQSLPASKMAAAGADWRTNPATQIRWGLNYIRSIYGSPAAAYSKWLSRSPHWYASGTLGAAPGWAWVGERGKELVNFHGGETVLPHDVSMGYQSGTLDLLRAERQRDVVQLAILQRELRNAGTALARAHYAAEIRVEQARIKILDERISKLLNAHQVALNKLAAAHQRALNRLAASHLRALQTAGATLAAEYARVTTSTTTTTFQNNLTRFLKDLRLYFTPSAANARSNLVISQTKRMESLEAQIKNLAARIAAAAQVQKDVLGSIQKTTGLTTIGIQGQGRAQAYNLLASLRTQTTTVRTFGTAIRDLARAGASPATLQAAAMMSPTSGITWARSMTRALRRLHAIKAPQSIINQLVAAGPEAANAYVDAINAAGPSVRRQIFAQAQALANAQLAVSRGAAGVISGGAYNTGANFVAGLQAQEKHLNDIFKKLGRTMAQEAIRWFNVPANRRPHGYQHGGWIEEPISGWGLWSGNPYMFAENGRREYVLSAEDLRAGHDGSFQGNAYHAHFDGLTGAAIESHVRTAFSAMALTQGSLSRQGRRS